MDAPGSFNTRQANVVTSRSYRSTLVDADMVMTYNRPGRE